jgi:lactoylglutathione lyase
MRAFPTLFCFDKGFGADYTEEKKEGRRMFRFNHFNFNVLDLERSLKFYDEALGLKPVREKSAADGSFKLVFLGDGATAFQLELTWMAGRTEPYDLGEQEFHLAFDTEDMDAAHAKHAAMGCICFENPGMGIYFIQDPDGYWIEIIPKK